MRWLLTERGRLLALGCLWSLLYACGASAPAAPLPRNGETAASELTEYAEFIEQVYPGRFRDLTRSAFAAETAREASRLRRLSAPSDWQVAAAFARVLAQLHDSHIAVTSESLQPSSPEARSLLPILVKDVAGELRVDAAVGSVPIGATLTAIDGISVAKIKAALTAEVSLDSSSDKPRLRALETGFTKLYHLAYGFAERYRLELRDASGTTELVVPGADHAAWLKLKAQRRSAKVWGAEPEDSAQLPFAWDFEERSTWIRLASFGSRDEAAYGQRVDEIMDASAASALIIDLRGNTGGLRTHGIALLNRILPRDYQQWQRMVARVHEFPQKFRARASAAFGTSFSVLQVFPEKQVAGEFVYAGDPLVTRMQPTTAFSGRLLVLVDGLVDSAANEFVVALKSNRPDTVLIGEEIGGACAEHIGELPVVWTTPTFHVSILASILRLEHVAVPGCRQGHGLEPDVAVEYTAEDFEQARDPYLDVVSATLAALPRLNR